MKKYLVFKDGASHKFWQIETDGKKFTVTYGRGGTSGVTQVKEFASVEKCEADAQKLVAEKLKKGYEEGSLASRNKSPSKEADYQASWQSLVQSKERQKALQEHFAYLSDSKTSSDHLISILDHVIDISISKDEELCLKLNLEGLYLVGTPPNKSINSTWPKRLNCVIVLSSLWFGLFQLDSAT